MKQNSDQIFAVFCRFRLIHLQERKTTQTHAYTKYMKKKNREFNGLCNLTQCSSCELLAADNIDMKK